MEKITFLASFHWKPCLSKRSRLSCNNLKDLTRHRHCRNTRKNMKCELTCNVTQAGVDCAQIHNHIFHWNCQGQWACNSVAKIDHKITLAVTIATHNSAGQLKFRSQKRYEASTQTHTRHWLYFKKMTLLKIVMCVGVGHGHMSETRLRLEVWVLWR